MYEDDTARNGIPKDATCITHNEFFSTVNRVLLHFEFCHVEFYIFYCCNLKMKCSIYMLSMLLLLIYFVDV